jgi:hypothetical protein
MEVFGAFSVMTFDEVKSVHEEKVRKAIRKIRKEK